MDEVGGRGFTSTRASDLPGGSPQSPVATLSDSTVSLVSVGVIVVREVLNRIL